MQNICISPTIEIRPPKSQEFIRTHPVPEYWLNTKLFYFDHDGRYYLVKNHLWHTLDDELTTVTLVPYMTRIGQMFLWPIKSCDKSGRRNSWITSAQNAANQAMGRWIRLKPNHTTCRYDVTLPCNLLEEAEWTDETLEELVSAAFEDHIIDSLEHPVIKHLMGVE